MIMKLSSEKQHLVLNNQKLVYYMIHKLGIIPNSSEYDDIISIGTMGLIKAAIIFDFSKNVAFSTYASRCIKNEVLMYFRKTNKAIKEISIDKTIGENQEGKNLRLLDVIEDPNSDFVQNIANKEESISESVLGTKKQIKQVREYMLSKDSFSVKDLKNHFPKYSANTINNALNLAKRKGLVTAISRGNYVVNKT